ncbi:MAG: BlaI/MecI/CopY family transcriptional regulator [Bdellovibrionales bacterium]|nr:BlaI/MecI/CopY family transcriptional regulator [Bdellovibrionales bacterium]
MRKAKTKVNDGKRLTETELELMTILWRLGEGSVADVIEQLPRERDLAYTSVSTILRILEQKEILKTRKAGRGHIYIPRLKKNDYEAKTVRHVVERVFDGTPVALVRQLLDSVKLDEKELRELKNLVDQAGRRK